QTLAGARTHALIGRGHVQLAYDEEAWSLAAQAIDAAQARLAAQASPAAQAPLSARSPSAEPSARRA
ncbi:MAG: hypothetical protein AB7S98_07060, partial [Burkholderiaceae bacterium]